MSSLAREAALFIAGALAYFLLRGLMYHQVDQAFANAGHIIEIERALRVHWEPALQHLIIGWPGLVRLANWVYIWGHWPLIGLVAVWLALRYPEMYRELRNAMLISGAIGLVFFAAFPVAPPRLADPAMVDTIALHSNAYRLLQPAAFTNQFAAMPSLHVGWNLLVGIAIARGAKSTTLRVFGCLVPVMMALAVVFTANHYLLDVVVGAMVALIGLALARRVLRPGSESVYRHDAAA